MTKLDDTLQEMIEKFEYGTPLDDLLDEIEPDQTELASLLKVAAAIKTVEHPTIAANNSPFLDKVRHYSGGNEMQSKRNKGTWWLIPATAFSALAVLMVCIVALGMGLWYTGPLMADSAKIVSLSGPVEVAAVDQPVSWNIVRQGSRVGSNHSIRTGVGASAVLEYHDGSRTILGPNTTLTFSEFEGGWGDVVKVLASQTSGSTSHKIVPFQTNKSFFIVQTPSGVATVRGTAFDISVGAGGSSRISVSKGSVQVSTALGQALVNAGQITTLNEGEDPETPSYQFSHQGVISAQTADGWTISGIFVKVDDSTEITGSPQVGDKVYVDGRVNNEGVWLASSIILASGDAVSTFTGVVEEIGESAYVISDKPVIVDDATLIKGDVQVGTTVKVIFTVAETGSWTALSINPLVEDEDDQGEDDDDQGEDEGNGVPKPSLSFEPDEIIVPICDGPAKATAVLANTGNEAKDWAKNVVLGKEMVKGSQYAGDITLTPPGWERIDAGQQVTFEAGVALNDAWTSAPEGAEVKARVFIASEENRPDHLRGRVTVTFVRRCEVKTPTPGVTPTASNTPVVTQTPVITGTPVVTQTPVITGTPVVTQTPVITGTPVVTQTPTITETPVGTPTQVTTCTGANPHPHGMQLAIQFGVPYEEIMGWFCQGFGFGEIELAYNLALQYSKPVTEIFALRMSGLGWGQIKKQLVPLTPLEQPGSQPSDGKKSNPGKGNKKP